jgi:large subunit ribosomal protein L21
MFAVVKTGGKQYLINNGDIIYTEKINGEIGKKVTLNEVLMVDSHIGTPFVNNAYVECEILKQGKQSKIVIIKHKSQKHHTKTSGHRQPYTKLLIKNIITK